MDPSPAQRGTSVEATRLERAGALASQASSLRPRDPSLRRGLYAAIAIVVVLSVGLAASAALQDLPSIEWRFRPAWLVPAVLGFAGLQLSNAELWRRLLHALGPSLTRRTATAIWCASALGRYVPMSVLMPMMRVAMAEREGVPKRICVASIVYELAIAFTAGLVVAAYFVIDLPELRGQPERFSALVLPLVALVLLQPAIFHRVADWTLERLGRERLPLALRSSRVVEFLALYALTYVIAGGSLYALAQAVYPIDSADAVTVMGAFAVGQALSFLAFMIPGGLVAREAGLAIALAPAMPAAAAIAVAVLVRIVQLALELVLAVLTSVVARSRRASSPAGAGRPAGIGAG
jgi:hypothetical protein